MKERKKHIRFSIELRARYLKENEEKWKDCTVTNISRSGIGIIVYIRERIPVGTFLRLEIIIPQKKEPLKVTGILRWIKEEEEGVNFMGGVEFTKLLDEIEWANLMCFMS